MPGSRRLLSLLSLFLILIPLDAFSKPRKKVKLQPEPQTEVIHNHTPANGPRLDSTHAILIDLTTGKVLYEKNADQQMAPSSMSKIMTAYLAFEALKEGRLKLDQPFPVSEKAWKKGGSRMFIDVNSQVKAGDLLRGIIVQSGNDASICLAEGIAGSEEAFAENMTRVAAELGCRNTRFINATGWPDEGHLTTVRDLALIARKTIERFPEYYPMYAETEFSYNNITQQNRNPLLGVMAGCDGMKTGHTDAGGFGLVASAVQDKGRRLVMVINGAKTSKQRAQDASALMQWGFSYYTSPLVFKKGDVVEAADVWLGDAPKVDLIASNDCSLTLPRHEMRDVKMQIVYKSPIAAPLKAGQEIGSILIASPSAPEKEIKLLAGKDVGKAGFFSRIGAALHYLFYGHNKE